MCEASDQCHIAGLCDPDTGLCSDPAADNGTQCDDGLFCTVNDMCTDGVCGSADAMDCSAAEDECNDGVCNEEDNACVASPKDAGTACGDALACANGVLTLADVCDGAGACGDSGEESCQPYSMCADRNHLRHKLSGR